MAKTQTDLTDSTPLGTVARERHLKSSTYLATVRVLRSFEELEEVREVWESWCDYPNADLDSYLASARSRADFVQPHVMIVYRQGRPECMLIGRLEHRRLQVKVGYATLFEPEIRQIFFVHGGFIGNLSDANSQLLARALRRCLENGEADLVEFVRLTKDSNLRAALSEKFGLLCSGHSLALHDHWWIELPATFNEFLQNLSRKTRHEFRRHQKMLDADFAGRMHVRSFRYEDEVDEMAREVEKVYQKTYQHTLGVGFKGDAETLESLRATARKGGLCGNVLYVGCEPIAFFVGKWYKDTLFGYYMGFDPEYGKYSPGLLILMHSVEQCFVRTGARRVDLGWGDRRYKRAICNQSKQDGPLYVYALSGEGLRLNLLRSVACFLDQTAKRMIANSRVLQRARKIWLEWSQQSDLKPQMVEEKCQD